MNNVIRYIPFKLSCLLKTKKIISKDINDKDVLIFTWKIVELVHLFLFKYYTRNNRITPLDLNSQVLRKMYGTHYKNILLYLINENIIEKCSNYSVGVKSNSYRLCRSVKKENIIEKSIILSKSNLFRFTSKDSIIPDDIKEMLIADTYTVDINYESAINHLEDKHISKKKNECAIKSIYTKELYHKEDKYGRFHTNFTILKKDIRKKYLSIDAVNLTELDIPNSQPLFLYLLLKNYGITEFNNYDTDVLQGKLYYKIYCALYPKQNTLVQDSQFKEAKKVIYQVLFGSNNLSKKSDRIFAGLYPQVYNWICEYKRLHGSYNILSHVLQRKESEYMFKTMIPIIKNYNPDIPIITIHDSIMFPEIYKNDIEHIWTECYNNLVQK